LLFGRDSREAWFDQPNNLSQKTESAPRAVAGQGEVAKIILRIGVFPEHTTSLKT
jgi:hypothetical protein